MRRRLRTPYEEPALRRTSPSARHTSHEYTKQWAREVATLATTKQWNYAQAAVCHALGSAEASYDATGVECSFSSSGLTTTWVYWLPAPLRKGPAGTGVSTAHQRCTDDFTSVKVAVAHAGVRTTRYLSDRS